MTRSVPDFLLVVGHPARPIGCVCRCGQPFVRFEAQAPSGAYACSRCGLEYAIDDDGAVTEVDRRP